MEYDTVNIQTYILRRIWEDINQKLKYLVKYITHNQLYNINC
jgi:hypothetical protein